jgi:hypothetical protein
VPSALATPIGAKRSHSRGPSLRVAEPRNAVAPNRKYLHQTPEKRSRACIKRPPAANWHRVGHYVLPVLGDMRVDELRPKHLKALCGALMDRGLSAVMIRDVVRSLSALLSDAIQDEVAELNPAFRFRFNAQRPARPRQAPAAQPDPHLRPDARARGRVARALWGCRVIPGATGPGRPRCSAAALGHRPGELACAHRDHRVQGPDRARHEDRPRGARVRAGPLVDPHPPSSSLTSTMRPGLLRACCGRRHGAGFGAMTTSGAMSGSRLASVPAWTR